ncbi:MAG: glycosyltransferase family 4 protein [Candidatus Aenigmatarchaeota archaeon]
MYLKFYSEGDCLRIALVSSNSFYNHGGIQNHIIGLYNYLKSKGHYVKIIAPKYKNERRLNKDFIFFGECRKINANASLADISLINKNYNAKKILDREKFDIIHFHNPGIFITTEILSKSNSKNIITFHFLPDASFIFKILKFFLKYIKKIKIVKKIDGIIFVSKPLKKYISNYFSCKKTIIPNGIDLTKFKLKSLIKKYKDDKINLLFLGRFEKRKGLIYLIKAFEILKKKYNIRLLIVGTGNLKKKYKKYVRSKKIDDVVFVGKVSDKTKIKYINTCDIFCAPSIYGESFGIVLLEAMACGKPIVGFANQGYKQVLNKKQKIFLAKPKDINQLANKIENLIKNKNMRKYLIKLGKEEVKKYSWGIVGKRIENFYKEILNEK